MRPGDSRLVSNFIVQARRGDLITIYGKGEQTRSFTYVDDLVEGIYRLFHSERADPTDIGNPGEFKIAELAKLVPGTTGSTSRITHLPVPEDDPKTRKPDITVARGVLDWQPRIELREGLERTIPFKRLVPEKGAAETLGSQSRGLLQRTGGAASRGCRRTSRNTSGGPTQSLGERRGALSMRTTLCD
jgi:hypothetical protein